MISASDCEPDRTWVPGEKEKMEKSEPHGIRTKRMIATTDFVAYNIDRKRIEE